VESSTYLSQSMRQAGLQALPVVFGYLPIGFAFGILARNAGVSAENALLMSCLVYAGSAQLIAVGLFASGISPISIMLTTFIVNLRHMLMSAALSPHLKNWKPGQLAVFAFELTDETFAVHSTRFSQGPATQRETLLINVISQTAWVVGTLLGVVAGQIISDVRPFGLDYALAAMFIALLLFQLKDKLTVLIALASGGLSVGLLAAGVEQWNVIIATVFCATLGLGLELWIKRSSS